MYLNANLGYQRYQPFWLGDQVSNSLKDNAHRKLKREARKKKWVKRLNLWTARLHALFWIVISSLVVYKTNFFRVAWEHPDRNMFFLDIWLICLVIYVVMIAYLTLFLPIFQGIHNWEERFPNIIPFLSCVGVALFISSFLAFFPVWGFLTIPIVIVIFMGFSMWLTFLPGGYLGTLLALVLMIAISATSHYIPHEGQWHYAPTNSTVANPT